MIGVMISPMIVLPSFVVVVVGGVVVLELGGAVVP